MRPERRPARRRLVGGAARGELRTTRRVALAEPAHAGVVLDVDAGADPERARRATRPLEEARAPDGDLRARPERHLELAVGERAHRQDRARRARRPRSSSRLGRRRRRRACVAPPRERRRGACDGAVAVAVGLDDGAELGTRRRARAREPARSCARPRRGRRARRRPPPARALTSSAPRAAPRSRRSRSPTRRADALGGEPARRARARATPAQAASKGSIPRASSAAIVPDSTSPVPAVASAGADAAR